jgi:hypothetical protein
MLEHGEPFPYGPQFLELIPAVVLNTTRDGSGGLQAFEMFYCVTGVGEFSYNQLVRRGMDWPHAAAQAEETLTKMNMNTSNVMLFDCDPDACDSRQGYLFLHFDSFSVGLIALGLATAVFGSVRVLARLCRSKPKNKSS